MNIEPIAPATLAGQIVSHFQRRLMQRGALPFRDGCVNLEWSVGPQAEGYEALTVEVTWSAKASEPRCDRRTVWRRAKTASAQAELEFATASCAPAPDDKNGEVIRLRAEVQALKARTAMLKEVDRAEHERKLDVLAIATDMLAVLVVAAAVAADLSDDPPESLVMLVGSDAAPQQALLLQSQESAQ